VLEDYDVLFSVGADLFTLSLPSDVDPMPPGITLIHLDVDPWEIGKNYPAAVGIQGDPKATLPDLCEAFRRETTKAGHKDAAKRRQALTAAHAAERTEMAKRAELEARQLPISPLSLVHAVAKATPDDAVIVDEAISSSNGIRTFFKCADPKSFFGIRGGGIGWGLPAAIGVKLGLPNRPVVALIGDGSAMYTNQALWTAARENLAVVYVIFNNGSYRILKQRTHALKGYSAEDDVYVGMDLTPSIDYIGLAKSLGVPGEHVEKTQDVGSAVGRALASGGPYLIDVKIDATFK
jgi:benzoylformate decarboxylase